MKRLGIMALIFAVLLAQAAVGQKLKKLAKPKKPTITYDRVDIKRITTKKAEVEFIYIVDNPNRFGLDHIFADYELFLENQRSAAGKDMKFKIKPKSKTELAFPMEIRYLDAFKSTKAMTKAILKGKKTIHFTLKTKFKVNLKLLKFSIPITAEGEIPLPKIKPKPPKVSPF